MLAQDENEIIISQYDALPAPLVAASWGQQLLLESLEDDRLGQFVRRFRGVGPEHAAPCSGVGTPA